MNGDLPVGGSKEPTFRRGHCCREGVYHEKALPYLQDAFVWPEKVWCHSVNVCISMWSKDSHFVPLTSDPEMWKLQGCNSHHHPSLNLFFNAMGKFIYSAMPIFTINSVVYVMRHTFLYQLNLPETA